MKLLSVLSMEVHVLATLERGRQVYTRVRIHLVTCFASVYCTGVPESCSLEVECKGGGRFHPKVTTMLACTC